MFSLDLCGCFFSPRVWLRALWWNDDVSRVYCCPATIIFVLPNQPDFLLPSTTLFPVNANHLRGSSKTFPNPSTVSRSGKMVLFKMSVTSHQKVSYSKVRPSYPVRPLQRMASSRGGSWVCCYSRNMDAHYRHPQFLKYSWYYIWSVFSSADWIRR